LVNKNKKDSKESKIIESESKTDIISKLVLLTSLGIVLILLVGVIFPALYTVSGSQFNEKSWYTSVVNPLEISSLAVPLIIINVIIFGIGFVIYKKNLKQF
jgi:hypothetical protein